MEHVKPVVYSKSGLCEWKICSYTSAIVQVMKFTFGYLFSKVNIITDFSSEKATNYLIPWKKIKKNERKY